MRRFVEFDKFLNEKKKASPAQIAAREKFKQMVAGKKKDAEPEEKVKDDNCDDCKGDGCNCDEPKSDKKSKIEKKSKVEKKTKKRKKLANFSNHTGGFKP